MEAVWQNLTLNLDSFVISSHCRGRAGGKAYLKGRTSKEGKVDFTTLTAWGFNGNGELGNGSTTNSSTPVEVGNLDGVEAIATGGSHNLALKDDGTVWAWGSNKCGGPARWISGQLGDDVIGSSSTPVEVGGLPSGVEAIAAGQCHSLALKDDGTVWAWGANLGGQLGNSTTTHHSSTPVQVKDPNDPSGYLSGVQAIATHSGHSLALKDDGTVCAWGGNFSGQL